MTELRVGFIGLGAMGAPMAANVAAAGFEMVVYDKAGTAERAPQGAACAGATAEVAARADLILTSLPAGADLLAVAREVIDTNERAVSMLIDLSTIGLEAALEAERVLAAGKIAFGDSPVSGGTAGAAAATIACMFSGSDELHERCRPALEALSKNLFHIGPRPGMGQTMKLLNNFLSATALAATCEAIAFGVTQGLDMKLMIDVLNVSSGRNTATQDKFPNRIWPQKYDAGFSNLAMLKDLSLYLEAVRAGGTAETLAAVVTEVMGRFGEAEPGADFTRIYPFVRDHK